MATDVLDTESMLQRKRQHVNSFKKALESDDEASDPGRQGSIEAVRRSKVRSREKRVREGSSNGLPRSASDTNLASKNRQLATNVQIDPGPPSSSAVVTKLPASLMTRHTFSGSSNKQVLPSLTAAATRPATASKTAGKRKRGDEENAKVPDEQQIFRGLHFYFFPNTDTNPARKLRISKARQFGATWEKNYSPSVSHVIVDKFMDFGLLMKFLKLVSLPASTIVVSETYPADCIAFRALIDPKLPQYKVKGYEPKPAKPSETSSDVSLQLKPASRSVMARQPETQTSNKRATKSPVEESSDEESGLEMAVARKDPKAFTRRPSTTDEFEVAVKQARELQDIPLDDEEGDSRPTSSSSSDTAPAPSPTKKKGKLSLEDRFQCMKPSAPSNANNPNAATIAILDQMSHYYDRIGDDWRTRAYRKAIGTLRNHPTKVRTKQEALALPQIGERLATKIEEIAFTNRLRRLDNAKTDVNDQILQTFMGVYGVGFAQASRWLDMGFTTLDELEAKADLTPNQRIGIAHYEDFNSRIPRVEVEQLGAIVRRALLKLNPGFEVIIGGSYRRGAETSGDIDCILTHKDPNTTAGYIRTIVLDRLVPKLFAADFLTAELAATSRDDGSKWHGACHLPTTTTSAFPTNKNPWRRIDLLLVPPAELGAALIYFTGNDIFNRSLRLLASTKGMRLNQRGLYRDCLRGKGRERVTEGTVVEARSERGIFEVLEVGWREAGERNC